jgi:hypothetical protein
VPFQCTSGPQVITILFILTAILNARHMTALFTLSFLLSYHEFLDLLIGAYKKRNYIITNIANVYYT